MVVSARPGHPGTGAAGGTGPRCRPPARHGGHSPHWPPGRGRAGEQQHSRQLGRPPDTLQDTGDSTTRVRRVSVLLQAALGVNTSLFTLSFVVFNFLATATTPAVAAAVGARNSQAAGEVVYQATALALLLGVGVAAGLYGNASWMLSVMGADPSQGEHMHDLAMQYLMIRWAVMRQHRRQQARAPHTATHQTASHEGPKASSVAACVCHRVSGATVWTPKRIS